MAQRYEIQQSVEANVSARLVALSGASVTVNDLRGTALTVFQAETGATTATNPLTTDANGQIEGWVEAPDFDLVVTRGASSTSFNSYTAHVRQSPAGVFNVKSYGAKGDGTTDDTLTMQAALDAAKNAGGGDTNAPATSAFYKVTTPLKVGTNVTLRGNALIKNTTNDNDVVQNDDQVGGNTNCCVRDVRISATAGSSFQKGIYFKKVTDGLITGTSVSGTYLQGIQCDQAVRNRVLSNTVSGIAHGNGISVDDNSADVVVEGNTIASVYDSGIGTHNGSVRTVIVGNTINTTTIGYGVDVYGAPETIISGNDIVATANHGIYIHTVTLNAFIPERPLVTGNIIKSAGGDGIQIFALADDQIHDCVIQGNLIYDPVTAGIYCGNGVQKGNISGNVIDSPTTGIQLVHSGSGTPYRLLITSNYIRGASANAIDGSANVSECVVMANYVGGNVGGIVFAGAGNLLGPNANTSVNRSEFLTDAFFSAKVGFNATAPIAKPTVTGSKGANAALASLMTALANYGLVTDSTT